MVCYVIRTLLCMLALRAGVLCRRTHQTIVNHCNQRHIVHSSYICEIKNNNNRTTNPYAYIMLWCLFKCSSDFTQQSAYSQTCCGWLNSSVQFTQYLNKTSSNQSMFHWISTFHLCDISLVVVAAFFWLTWANWVYGFIVFQKSLPSYWRQ